MAWHCMAGQIEEIQRCEKPTSNKGRLAERCVLTTLQATTPTPLPRLKNIEIKLSFMQEPITFWRTGEKCEEWFQ